MASPSQADFETLKGDFEVLRRQLSEGLQPKIDNYDAAAAQFATWRTTVDVLLSSQDKNHRELYDLANIHISEIKAQMGEMQKAMVAGGGGGGGERGKEWNWQMTRPKDMVPGMFCGKDEDWPQWKESVEDYVEKSVQA